jgi:hypothetical protein
MSELLLALVKECLVPALEPLGFSVLDSDVSASFDDAIVTLRALNLGLRIVRDRSLLFADFGPASGPQS